MEKHYPQINKIENNIYEKQKKWDAFRKKADTIIDGMGLGIDESIKDAVTTLNVMGFTTDSSCAGHKSEEDGFGTPYIQVSTPCPDWKKSREIRELWKQENDKQRERLQPLLEEFNKNRKTIEEARIHFRNIGGYGTFRLQSIGAEDVPPKTLEEAAKRITLYQKEMADFTSFLKENYLKSA